MDLKIKPCPLCGSSDLKLYTTESRQSYRRGYIRCNNCGCNVTAEGEYMPSNGLDDCEYRRKRSLETAKERVAEKWNHRERESIMADLINDMFHELSYVIKYEEVDWISDDDIHDYKAKMKLLDIWDQ